MKIKHLNTDLLAILLNLLNFLILYPNEYLHTSRITSAIFCFPKLNFDLKDSEDFHNHLVPSGTSYHKTMSYWLLTVSTADLKLCFPLKWNIVFVGIWHAYSVKNSWSNEVRIVYFYLQFTQYLTFCCFLFFFISMKTTVKGIKKWHKIELLK